MTRRKIVVLTNLFPNAKEPGRGTFIRQLVQRLNQDFSITVVAPLPWRPGWRTRSGVPEHEVIDGVPVYHPRHLVIPKILRFTYAYFMSLAIYPLLKKLQSAGDCEFISAHWVYPDGVAAVKVARRLKIPISVHCLGCDINDYTRYWLRRIQIAKALSRADAVVAKSRDLARQASELGAGDRVKLIPNGLDREKFRPGDKAQARQALELEPSKAVLLYVGNFNIEKNVVTLINGFAAAQSAGIRDTELVLVGDGPESSRIQAAIEQGGLQGQVRLVGRQPHDVIGQYYHAADFLCLPSLREGCPNVVLEALGSGLPVLAAKVGAVPDIIGEGQGATVWPNTSQNWAATIKSALDQPLYRVDDFDWPSWEQNAASVRDVILQAIGQSSR